MTSGILLLCTRESQQFTDYARSLRCISAKLELRGKQQAYDDTNTRSLNSPIFFFSAVFEIVVHFI